MERGSRPSSKTFLIPWGYTVPNCDKLGYIKGIGFRVQIEIKGFHSHACLSPMLSKFVHACSRACAGTACAPVRATHACDSLQIDN